jgi:uncharacterized membrane protein YccC
VHRPELPDPGHHALKGAARAAIVVPSAFAFALGVLGDDQSALFASFGAMALLVFAEFSGPWRERLVAYLGLAVVGVVLIALGTLASRSTWLAVALMAVVGFAVLFSGIIDGYFAAAGSAAILLFALPVMIPAPASAIPARLEGWAVACAAAIPAATLLWPGRPRDAVRASVADGCRALADLVQTGSDATAGRFGEAVARVRRVFTITPYRPTGPTGRSAALARLVDDLGWTHAFAMPRPGAADPTPEATACRAAAAHTLRGAAGRLDGGDDDLALESLERARRRIEPAFVARATGAVRALDERALAAALDEAFVLRGLAASTWLLGRHALLAAGAPAPPLDAMTGRPPMVTAAVRELATAHASMRSVWFRNSLRGAAGLALAVLVAQLADVQNGFWVVLGTLSVLRSRALGTGSSIVEAIAGTVVGIIVGGALLALVGPDQALRWVLLALLVGLAAYALRAISFGAGQAAFSILVLFLFDLLEPTGWKVGLIRVEDVVLGCAVSLAVGLLLWPRGARGILRARVAEAYERSVDYAAAAAVAPLHGDGDVLDGLAGAAMVAGDRLDDAFRQYLAERRTAEVPFESVSALIGGAARLRQVGNALRAEYAAPAAPGRDGPVSEAIRDLLDAEARDLRGWFHALGDAIVRRTAPPAPEPSHARARSQVLLWWRDGAAERDAVLAVAWALEDLAVLRRIEPTLSRAAEALGR